MKKLLGIIVFSFFFNNFGLSNEKYICIEKKPNTIAKYNLHHKSSCPDQENFVFKIYKNKYPESFNKLDIYLITKWRSSEPDVDAFGIDIINMTRADKIFDFNKGEIVLMPNVILDKKTVNKLVNQKNCDPLYLGKTKIKIKENICIYEKDIKQLVSYKEKIDIPYIFPDEIEKVLISKCGKKTNGRKRSRKCMESAAGGKVYELFVKRGDVYHARYPGKIIEGMAWFEISYLYKHSASQKHIDRYVKYGPDNYQNITEFGLTNLISKLDPKTVLNMDKKKLSSIIKMNKGRLKMRKAVGLNSNDDLNEVIDRHIVLSNFLNKDKLKVKKNRIDPQLKKREELLKKYKTAITKYKEKLEEVYQ